MRDVDRRIRCSDLNNELRAANIELNGALRRQTDAKNKTRFGPSDISQYEYQITQINTQLAALSLGSYVGGRVGGLFTAGEIIRLQQEKRTLQEKIAQKKREIQDAREELIKVKPIIELQ